jgi:hypothetical protein
MGNSKLTKWIYHDIDKAMTNSKIEPSHPGVRGEPLRQRVIDAAERLLRNGKADFSMRDLAAEACSARRIDMMESRFVAAQPLTDTAERVLLAIDTAAGVMLEEPEVNRAVMGWLGSASSSPGQVWARSTALWTLALGAGDGLIAARRDQALRCLPRQLAFAFRGVLSFWTAGELREEELAPSAREIAGALLLGFTEGRLSGDPGS